MIRNAGESTAAGFGGSLLVVRRLQLALAAKHKAGSLQAHVAPNILKLHPFDPCGLLGSLWAKWPWALWQPKT